MRTDDLAGAPHRPRQGHVTGLESKKLELRYPDREEFAISKDPGAFYLSLFHLTINED